MFFLVDVARGHRGCCVVSRGLRAREALLLLVVVIPKVDTVVSHAENWLLSL